MDEIAETVARRRLSTESVDRVEVGETTDLDGREALRVVIVLKDGAIKSIEGRALLDTLVDLNTSLRDAGDERRPIVEYAEVGDTDDDADPEL